MTTRRSTRATGEFAVAEWTRLARARVQRQVRRSLGVRGNAPATCVDPDEAYLPVDGAARTVHGDLASMLVGGVASLLLQILHPLVMTGVAEHSRYREDPLGRLARTATFVGTTTYGSRADALAAVARVRKVHDRVQGESVKGVSYRANDSHLLEWVHLTELSMFLAGVRAYGPRNIDDELANHYVSEMALVASDLGVTHPPRDVESLTSRLEEYRPELELTDVGREARDFVLRGVSRRPQERLAYATLAAAAVGVLPPWARRQLEIPRLVGADTLIVRPAAMALCATLRLAVPPAPQSSSGDR